MGNKGSEGKREGEKGRKIEKWRGGRVKGMREREGEKDRGR